MSLFHSHVVDTFSLTEGDQWDRYLKQMEGSHPMEFGSFGMSWPFFDPYSPSSGKRATRSMKSLNKSIRQWISSSDHR